ncbi:hypothetical protein Poly24_55000 [Rosistilla carotiformis]|uniref:Uncharacterized protein n=1 Tax=Rosistilla carotiformis TaxID=2528017 RepID=A0A518K1X2_9BACT|nr:hypothetical protein Poly24_55000 [Rosistilla carotiformis]
MISISRGTRNRGDCTSPDSPKRIPPIPKQRWSRGFSRNGRIARPHRIPTGSQTVAGGLSAANTTGNIHKNRSPPPTGAHIHNVQTRPANRKMAKPWQDKAWGRKSQVTGLPLQPKVAERRQDSTSQTRPANHANTANDIIDSQTERKTRHHNEPTCLSVCCNSRWPLSPLWPSIHLRSLRERRAFGPQVPEVRRCATTSGYLLASLRDHAHQPCE